MFKEWKKNVQLKQYAFLICRTWLYQQRNKLRISSMGKDLELLRQFLSLILVNEKYKISKYISPQQMLATVISSACTTQHRSFSTRPAIQKYLFELQHFPEMSKQSQLLASSSGTPYIFKIHAAINVLNIFPKWFQKIQYNCIFKPQ